MCGEGFLNGQLTVSRGLGDFHPEALASPRAAGECLKYRACSDAGQPLHLVGPLISGAGACLSPSVEMNSSFSLSGIGLKPPGGSRSNVRQRQLWLLSCAPAWMGNARRRA